MSIVPVVLSGGSGTRLWPLSRALYPKQFLALAGEHTLLQQAVLRLVALGARRADLGAPLLVGAEAHRFLLLDQLRELGLGPGTLVLEPAARNTAPALSLAALAARAGGEDPVLLVSPADHAVADGAAFTALLEQAVAAAEAGQVVTLGVQPTRPETGYGYIRSRPDPAGGPVRRVEAFVEKPDRATAERYLAEGGYAWNSGLFVLKASVWLAALAQARPAMAEAVERAWTARREDGVFLRPDREAFEAVPADSIDYAVMEGLPGRADAVAPLVTLTLDAGWNDLGAWDAVWQLGQADAAGNVQHGDTLVEASRNCLVHASHRLVAAVGVEDLVVVETPDAVLVADRRRAQEVKQVVARLQREGRGEDKLHRRVHRPWGWYDSVDAGPRFQVKRILVKPGASLSLQMHHHRAEHWIVVSGTAEVTCGPDKRLVTENQSTYIPLGATHRLANPGSIPLEIIEVQSGSYLGEDDIVRFDDHYGRHTADPA